MYTQTIGEFTKYKTGITTYTRVGRVNVIQDQFNATEGKSDKGDILDVLVENKSFNDEVQASIAKLKSNPKQFSTLSKKHRKYIK